MNNKELTKDAIGSLKKQLEQDRDSRTEELKSFAKKDPRVAGDWDTIFPHYGSSTIEYDENASETEAYQNLLPVEHTLEMRLKDIEEALHKIETDSYGICEQCSNQISLSRLQAKPEARLCIPCRLKKDINKEP